MLDNFFLSKGETYVSLKRDTLVIILYERPVHLWILAIHFKEICYTKDSFAARLSHFDQSVAFIQKGTFRFLIRY